MNKSVFNQNKTKTLVNENTKTIVIAYDINTDSPERNTHFYPEEIAESDGYIVSYPYGEECPIVATINNETIYLVIDRDCYDIPLAELKVVGDIAEIWYDTEDVTFVREYFKNKK